MNIDSSKDYLISNGLGEVGIDTARQTHVDTHRLSQCPFTRGYDGEIYFAVINAPVTQQGLDALIHVYRDEKGADAFATYIRKNKYGTFIFCKAP